MVIVTLRGRYVRQLADVRDEFYTSTNCRIFTAFSASGLTHLHAIKDKLRQQPIVNRNIGIDTILDLQITTSLPFARLICHIDQPCPRVASQ